MPDYVNINQTKQQSQYLNMRGAQIAEEKPGVNSDIEPQTKAKGTRKQLISTIVGIAAVFAVLILLKVLNVI